MNPAAVRAARLTRLIDVLPRDVPGVDYVSYMREQNPTGYVRWRDGTSGHLNIYWCEDGTTLGPRGVSDMYELCNTDGLHLVAVVVPARRGHITECPDFSGWPGDSEKLRAFYVPADLLDPPGIPMDYWYVAVWAAGVAAACALRALHAQ